MIFDTIFYKNYGRIISVVALYWVVSITTVFVNKYLLDDELDAPLFVTWFQCLVTTIILTVLSWISKLNSKFNYVPEISPWKYENFIKILPLAIIFTGMIAFNNLCLKYVDVAFYYIGRSLTTVFNVILTQITLKQKISRATLVTCFIIVNGFWLGVYQENVSGALSFNGTVFGILGSLLLSLYSIYTKKILPFVNEQVVLLSYYNNFYAIFLFMPFLIYNNELIKVMNYERINEFFFWFLLTIGGICGLSIGFVTTLQIKVTSPLTHNISGTAKACAQTILATYWYRTSRPVLWWISNAIVLFGSAAYARVKQIEMETNMPSQKTLI